MSDLSAAITDIIHLLDSLRIEYAIMGGIAVRVYGIPRATNDVDITAAIRRPALSTLFDALQARRYTVPEPYLSGWGDQVGGMPLVKFRLVLEERGIDSDVFWLSRSIKPCCSPGGAGHS